MKLIKIIIFSLFLVISIQTYSAADTPHFLDFKYILNNSDAGKKAQEQLQKKLSTGVKKLQADEKKLQADEKKIIQQKKIINADEYKKKVAELRTKVNNLQKERNKLLGDVSTQRSKARSELLKNLNPIIADYMKEKKIRMIVDKKSILLADETLDVTKDIIKILNNKLKSIKLN